MLFCIPFQQLCAYSTQSFVLCCRKKRFSCSILWSFLLLYFYTSIVCSRSNSKVAQLFHEVFCSSIMCETYGVILQLCYSHTRHGNIITEKVVEERSQDHNNLQMKQKKEEGTYILPFFTILISPCSTTQQNIINLQLFAQESWYFRRLGQAMVIFRSIYYHMKLSLFSLLYFYYPQQYLLMLTYK